MAAVGLAFIISHIKESSVPSQDTTQTRKRNRFCRNDFHGNNVTDRKIFGRRNNYL